MENTSHANNQQTATKRVLIYAPHELVDIINQENSFELVLDRSLSNIEIDHIENQYRITSNLDNSKEVFVTKQNISYFLKKLLKLHKNHQSLKNFHSKNAGSLLKDELFWKQNHHDLLELNSIFRKSKSINDFTKNLFQFDFFSKFSSIHLFIHEKGSASSKHVQITKSKVSESLQNISEFSSLFQAVKKSKNRSFGQSTLKASNFQIIGTCIAQEFSLLNHNLIFLFSKDDFIAQDQEDIVYFNNLKTTLKTFIELILNTQFNVSKSIIISNTIKTLAHSAGHELNLPSNGDPNFLKDLEQIQFTSIINSLREKNFDHADVNLQERISLLGELLNTLQHELSNPLFGLQLSSELLLGENLDEEQYEFMGHIVQSIKRSQSILSNFQDLYKDTPTKEDIDLSELLNEVFTLTKSETRSVKKDIQLATELEDKLIIHTNPTWLAQIFFNLIVNSSQAMRNDNTLSPKISILISKTNDIIKIIFSDNGPGIQDSKISNIFDPFYTTKSDGNGLGLAISKKLSMKLDGDLKYIKKEVGACFQLEISI